MAKRKCGQIKEVISPNEAVLTDGTKVISPNVNLIDDFYTSVMSQLSGNKISKSGNSVLQGFVGQGLSGLKSAVVDPEKCVTAMKYFGNLVVDTQKYYDEKSKGDEDFSKYLIDKALFPWQKNVAECLAKKICLICGRRSGKSYALAKIAVRQCVRGKDRIENNGIVTEKPVQVIIIGLTISRAGAIYWDAVKQAAEDSRLPISHIDNGAYLLEFANGASIQLAGVASKAEIEKIRGADFSVAIVDECQSVKGLRNLMVNVLGPIIKGRNGIVYLAGTAPLSAATYWEEIINDDRYTHFTATMEDNPSIPNYKDALQQVLDENGWDENNSTFRREYKAEVVYDYDLIIYGRREHYDPAAIDYGEFTHCTIGADWGWSDSSAFEPVLYNSYGEMIELKPWKQAQADVSTIVKSAKELVDKIHTEYKIPMENIKIVADSSNGNVNGELYNKGLTMLQNAYKVDKLYQIKLLKESLATGQLKVYENGAFDEEADKIVWKQDPENGRIIYEVDDAVFHGDSSDALRYAVSTILTDLNLYSTDA